MAILSELSTAVRARRQELGLSQQRLAEISGLSRATVNALETTPQASLSLERAERLANALGLSLSVSRVRSSDTSGALARAAKAASVSYSQIIPEGELERSIINGVIAPKYIPQLKSLLDEVPISVLSDMAEELKKNAGVSKNAMWVNMRTLARALGCTRPIWLDHAS